MPTPFQLDMLAKWEAARSMLEKAKLHEMELRKQVQTSFFPTPKEGTQRVELAAGWSLKFVHKTNYSFDDKIKLHFILTQIEALGEEGPFIAKRLIKFTPELSLTEYKALTPPYRKLIDEVLVTKPASPSLELEAPKVKSSCRFNGELSKVLREWQA